MGVDRLGGDLRRLVAALGSPVVRIDNVTGLPSPVFARRTFRITLGDGRVVKGRRVDDPNEVARMVLLRSALADDRFSRIVAAFGTAIIEEWIDGLPLTLAEAADFELLLWSGTALAGVHAADVPRRAPATWVQSTDQTADELAAHLRALVGAGLLARRHARRLLALAAERRPETAEARIVHRDLWWGNVVRTDGTWRIVDNASLDLAAPALDLARTRHTWPMSVEGWAVFLAGYSTRADARAYVDHAVFWDAVVLAEVATFRRRARTGGVRHVLAKLRSLASPEGDDRSQVAPALLDDIRL